MPLADVTLQQKDMVWRAPDPRPQAALGRPGAAGAAANEMMNACRGLGIDHNDFVTAHEVYRAAGRPDGMKCTKTVSHQPQGRVPLVQGLKRDDGWIRLLRVQFLIDKKSGGADHVVG